MSGDLLLVYFFFIVFCMCAFDGGALLIFSLKLMKQKFNIRQKCRMPTITTVTDGSVCARCAAKHFGPGNDPLPPVDEESTAQGGDDF